MSTDTSVPPLLPAASSPRTRRGPRVYPGRSIDELIPRIEAELGTDAIVVRRTRGLEGGIGGFFQRPLRGNRSAGGDSTLRHATTRRPARRPSRSPAPAPAPVPALQDRSGRVR